MPSKSAAQHRLMECAAHTPGGCGGVPPRVGKEFVAKDSRDDDTELDVAKKIMLGAPSPQRIGNSWLFDVRITGTGISYRDSIDEYVYRPPQEYLTDEFLDRCNGLPVIFDHPEKGMLNTEEWRNRIIGTIILPYISEQEDEWHKDGDVWGIARIFDADAAELMLQTHISTSPAVTLAESGNTIVLTEDKRPLLIEGKPQLLDHLAVCEAGVWDKGAPPRGIRVN
jgi:hypothetical protein